MLQISSMSNFPPAVLLRGMKCDNPGSGPKETALSTYFESEKGSHREVT